MKHNTETTTDGTSSFHSEPPRSSCNVIAGEEPFVSTLRPNHEEYELPSETPFTAEIVNVAYSATEADIRQAFSSLPVKEVRSPSNIPGTFFVEFLDVQGLKQCLDQYWMFMIHDRPILPSLLNLMLNLNHLNFALLHPSFQSPSRCLRVPQPLLTLINVHLLRLICKSSLEWNNYLFRHHFLNYCHLTNDIRKFFKKVGYTSKGFFECALLATKVFFQRNTLNVVSYDLPQLVSFASFFGAEVQSVFLGVCESCDVEEFQSYSHVISGLELRLENHNDLEFLNKSSLCFPRLKELHVDVISSQALHLFDLLKVNETVTCVHLRDSYIGGEGVRALADALKVNTAVTSLDLSGNSIEDKVVRVLADVLKVNAAITSLDLSYNSIGDDGARALADALKVNTTLISLDLGGNCIQDEGVRALADALTVNKTLTSLDLSVNSVGDEGVKALADTLKVNASITVLDLRCNYIGDEGARAFADVLKVNNSVTSLDLDENAFEDEGAGALSEALKVNSTVKLVGLSYFNM
ncbi:hypothetical protein GEMRC1_009769 [Eukaryota sp. GEM-RC1]